MKKLDRKCDKCGANDVWFCQNRVIYGRNFGAWPYVVFCRACSAAVGCRRGTENPLGTMTDSRTRQLRAEAHAIFDPIWKDGWITRTDAYLRLAGLMGIKSEDCHFSHMNSRELKKAMTATFDLIEEVSREADINE